MNSSAKSLPSVRLIGILFLAAFPAYGLGNSLLHSEQSAYSVLGAALIVLNSVIVLAIGVLLFRIFRSYRPLVARGYLAGRFIEAVLLGMGVLGYFALIPIDQMTLYNLGLLALSIASVALCNMFYSTRFTPPWLAVWGAIGYGLLAIGLVAGLFGLSIGLILSIPGGAWEIIFAVVLILKRIRFPVEPLVSISSPR